MVGKDVRKNILYVSQREGEELFSVGMISEKFNWIPEKPNEQEFDCFAKFRYRQPDQKVHVKIVDDHIEVCFYEKQRAVTPGQFVVLYQNDEEGNSLCLGGAVIDKVLQ